MYTYIYIWIIWGLGANSGEVLLEHRPDLALGEVKSIVQKARVSELQDKKTRACAVCVFK